MCCFWAGQAWHDHHPGVPVPDPLGRWLGSPSAVCQLAKHPLHLEGKEHSPLWADVRWPQGKKRIKGSIRAWNIGKNPSSFTAARCTAGMARPDSPHSLLILQMWSRNKQQSALYYIIKWGLSLINIFQGLQGRTLLSSLWFWQGSCERAWTFFRPVWEGRTNSLSLKPHQTSQSQCQTVQAFPRPSMPRPSSDGDQILLFGIHSLTEVLPLPAPSLTVGPTPGSSLQSKGRVLHRLGCFNQADVSFPVFFCICTSRTDLGRLMNQNEQVPL